MPHDDPNPYSQASIAQQWIDMIEGPAGRVRDEDIYPRVRAWLEASPHPDVLEIGCGQGICSAKLDLQARQYTGVEPSPHFLARARELYAAPHLRFVAGDAYALPLAAESMDAAFSVAVWHLLHNPTQAAREMARVLRPGGSFLIISANPAAYSLWTSRYVNPRTQGHRFEGYVRQPDGSLTLEVLYLHAEAEIAASLVRAGLTVQSIATFRPSDSGLDQFIAISGRKKAGA